MCLDDKLWCSSLKAYASLYADDGVAYVGIAADGIAGANLLDALDSLDGVVEGLVVDTYNLALVKLYLEQCILLGSDMFEVSFFGQSLSGVEQLASADAGAPDAYVVRVLQLGEVGLETVVVQIVNLFLAREFLVACQGDDFYAGSHHQESHIEADLVVAGTCRAVGDGVSPDLLGIAGDG